MVVAPSRLTQSTMRLLITSAAKALAYPFEALMRRS
jgi:hypothetical protein